MTQAVAMVPRAQTIGASGAAVSDIYIYVAGTYRQPGNSHAILDPDFARVRPQRVYTGYGC